MSFNVHLWFIYKGLSAYCYIPVCSCYFPFPIGWCCTLPSRSYYLQVILCLEEFQVCAIIFLVVDSFYVPCCWSPSVLAKGSILQSSLTWQFSLLLFYNLLQVLLSHEEQLPSVSFIISIAKAALMFDTEAIVALYSGFTLELWFCYTTQILRFDRLHFIPQVIRSLLKVYRHICCQEIFGIWN